MRAYRGARFLTGRPAARGNLVVRDFFKATLTGTCKGCWEKYHPGDLVWSQGKGLGALHHGCYPQKARQANESKRADRETVKQEIAAWNAANAR